MKNHVILALSLSVALVGCSKSSNSSSGGYSSGGSASTAPAATQAPATRAPATTTTTTTGPTISGITPTSGAPGTLVTITGANFANLTDVQIGGIWLINAAFASTEIQGTLGNGAAGQVGDVVVFSPTGNATDAAAFTYTAAATTTTTTTTTPPAVTYTNTIQAMISASQCLSCHSSTGGYIQGLDLSSYADSNGHSGVQTMALATGATSLVSMTAAGGLMNGYLADPVNDPVTIANWVAAGAPQ